MITNTVAAESNKIVLSAHLYSQDTEAYKLKLYHNNIQLKMLKHTVKIHHSRKKVLM